MIEGEISHPIAGEDDTSGGELQDDTIIFSHRAEVLDYLPALLKVLDEELVLFFTINAKDVFVFIHE